MNARQEFIDHVGSSTVICARINGSILKVGHNELDLDEFLLKIDFDYDEGYGSQQLHGIIWFTDGTWSTRGEYDGSEWWEHHSLPEIPAEYN